MSLNIGGSGVANIPFIERILKRDMSLITDIANDGGELQSELDSIDLDNPLTYYLIFSAIFQAQFVEAIPWFLDAISLPNDYVEPEAKLFTVGLLPNDVLTYIVNSAPDRFSLVSVIDSLIAMDSDEKTYDACRKAVQVLGTTDFDSWVSFCETANGQGNAMVWFFCMEQARKVSPFAKKPFYMKKAPRDLDTGLINLSDDTIKKFNPEKDKIENYIKEIEEAPEKFRVLGPANIKLGATLEELEDGRAELRMFNDNRFTSEDEDHWFTGSCDKCWKRIKTMRFAVRKPIESGGWKEQYCSWNCVRDSCEDFETVPYEMTYTFEKQMNGFGIYENLNTPFGATLGSRSQLERES